MFSGEWQTNLIRCFPCGPFWRAICCPCVVYGETAQRLRDPTVDAEKDNDECVEFGRDYCLFSTCALDLKEHRAEIRRRYRIKGSPANDCLVSCFCSGCVVMQHDDELKARLAAAGVGSSVVGDQYKAEEPMQMQMQIQAPGRGGHQQGYTRGTAQKSGRGCDNEAQEQGPQRC
ncbi:PLAC8 family-domain-containing protein [Corynascus novoguineensis]|uniref:PLAC8 family-domain-containing protein n=1 Tax=Corynascus novoguineensis TaxID=1126955 RepID=A0AAN7CSF0_9PEZI|nr:PLAC8 family-domain-containing protein [Corynascus novoguineensis]